jgi:predicted kinase
MKLIILYGFASSGKSTLAKRYTENHPMTIAIEGDELIGMIGGWRNDESDARQLVFEYTKSIADIHLGSGHDVVIPYLLNEASHSAAFKQIATKHNAEFYEVYIDIGKEDAVNRLISRGCWGEKGSRALTEQDREELEGRFDYMENVMQQPPNVIPIESELNDIDAAYQNLITSTTA